MAIHSECMSAARSLIRDESLHAPEHRGFFTDLDVVLLAERRAGGYKEHERREAITQANTVLTRLFERREVARYGPVKLPGIRDNDYARIASRIIHAAPDGPASFVSPNGTFSQMLAWQGDKLRTGRRFLTNRDDREPWDESELKQASLREQLARLRAS